MDRQEPVKTAETSRGHGRPQEPDEAREPLQACVGVRPCPPLALVPGASSSVKEQRLQLQPPGPRVSSSPRMRVQRPASTHTPAGLGPAR